MDYRPIVTNFIRAVHPNLEKSKNSVMGQTGKIRRVLQDGLRRGRVSRRSGRADGGPAFKTVYRPGEGGDGAVCRQSASCCAGPPGNGRMAKIPAKTGLPGPQRNDTYHPGCSARPGTQRPACRASDPAACATDLTPCLRDCSAIPAGENPPCRFRDCSAIPAGENPPCRFRVLRPFAIRAKALCFAETSLPPCRHGRRRPGFYAHSRENLCFGQRAAQNPQPAQRLESSAIPPSAPRLMAS